MNIKALASRLHPLSLAIVLTTIQEARSQISISNLGEAWGNTAFAIDFGRWIGMSFTVGNDSSVWHLDKVELVLSMHSNLTVELHQNVAGIPGPLITSLLGDSNPPTGTGTNAYSPLSFTSLNANETYWVTVAKFSFGAEGWFFTSPPSLNETGLPGWSIGDSIASSRNQGANWSIETDTLLKPALIAISATAVPEPSIITLLGMLVGIYQLPKLSRQVASRTHKTSM